MPLPVDDYIRYRPPALGVAPSFDGGTEAQQAWVTEALGACTYPWQRSPVPVVWGFSTNPAPAIHYEVAYTTNTPNTETDFGDSYNARADAVLNPNLIVSGSSVYAGLNFAREVVVHELAHALLGSFDLMVQLGRVPADWQARFCAMFGADLADWEPVGSGIDAWKGRVLEAVCETFKDIYLPRALRSFDNRTRWRLQHTSLDDFLDMFEGVATFRRAPASSPWRTSEPLRSASAISYNNLILEGAEFHRYTNDAIEEAPAAALDAIDVPPIEPYGGRVALRFLPAEPGRPFTVTGTQPYNLTDWTVSGRLQDDLGALHAVFDEHNPSFTDAIEAALTLPAGRTLLDWYISANIVKVPFFQYTDNLDFWADGLLGQSVAWFYYDVGDPPRPQWPYRTSVTVVGPIGPKTRRVQYAGNGWANRRGTNRRFVGVPSPTVNLDE